MGQAVTSFGDDGWQREGATSISDDNDVESLAAASILVLFFGVLLAITQSIVEYYGRLRYVQEYFDDHAVVNCPLGTGR